MVFIAEGATSGNWVFVSAAWKGLRKYRNGCKHQSWWQNTTIMTQCRHNGKMQKEVHRNVQQFRKGLVFKARGLLYHSILGLRVIKMKKMQIKTK